MSIIFLICQSQGGHGHGLGVGFQWSLVLHKPSNNSSCKEHVTLEGRKRPRSCVVTSTLSLRGACHKPLDAVSTGLAQFCRGRASEGKSPPSLSGGRSSAGGWTCDRDYTGSSLRFLYSSPHLLHCPSQEAHSQEVRDRGFVLCMCQGKPQLDQEMHF